MSTCLCPRCHDEISLPLRGRPSSRVQCPLCLEEMFLEEVLAKMPPALILLDEEEEAPSTEWVSSSAKSAYETEDVSQPSYMSQAATADMGSLGSSVAASPPRPRRQPNVLVEMVKIVVGGVVGIALAIVAIWWIAKTDPFKLGPTVSKYLPQIVPEKFQGETKKVSSIDEIPVPPPVKKNPPQVVENPVNPPDKKLTVDPKFEDILNGRDPNKKPPMDPEDPLAVVDPLNPNPEVKNPEPESTKRYSGAELQQELQTAMAALDAYKNFVPKNDGNDKSAKQRLAMELFAAAGPVGYVASQVDPREADVEAVLPALKEYLANVTEGNVGMLSYLTGLRIDGGDGVVCPGTVKKFKAVGEMFETELELALRSGPKMMTIVSRSNPQDIAAVDEKVVVLGAVVREPKRIKGYEGNSPTVILSGYIQKLE